MNCKFIFSDYHCSIYVDSCPGGSLQFDGQVGVFIDGKIEPPLQNVKVVIQSDSTKKSNNIFTVFSNAEGKYRSVYVKKCTQYFSLAYKFYNLSFLSFAPFKFRIGPLHGNLNYDLVSSCIFNGEYHQDVV